MRGIVTAGIVGLALGTASGDVVRFESTYTGRVNGGAIEATGDGMIDLGQGGGSSAAITFTERPSSFDPSAVSLISNLCTNSFQTNRGKSGSQNLFDLAGGNYTVTRAFQWVGLPGSAVFIDSVVTNGGGEGVWFSDSVLRGTYRGPTDIIGISEYSIIWQPSTAPGEFFESGTAVLKRANGESLILQFSSVFSGLSSNLEAVQFGAAEFDLSFENETLTVGWDGVFEVPSAGTLPALAIGVLLGARRRRG